MKPILFNADMVRAVLEDRKTVTRRVVKPQPKGAHTVLDCDEDEHTFDLLCGNCGVGGIFVDLAETIKAPFWPGDILYVRETWQKNPYGIGWPYFYKASPEEFDHASDKWCPSIHMPREAARIFLRVTDVRVERLRDISLYDVWSEGTPQMPGNTATDDAVGHDDFAYLWNSTIKPSDRTLYGWEASPWVWVISFERISREEALQCDD